MSDYNPPRPNKSAEDKSAFDIETLPQIPPMPKPPQGPYDYQKWQTHIASVEQYIISLNIAIETIKKTDLSQSLKTQFERRGVDIDKMPLSPQAAKEITRQFAKLSDEVTALGQSMGRAHSQRTPSLASSKRNIKSI